MHIDFGSKAYIKQGPEDILRGLVLCSKCKSTEIECVRIIYLTLMHIQWLARSSSVFFS